MSSPLVARIAAAADPDMGPEAFLDPRLADLPGLDALAGLGKGGEMLARAIADNRPVAVFGDYDADGVTAAAIVTLFVRACGGRAFTHLPNRLKEGYGVDVEAVERMAARTGEGGLLVTVDCGTGADDALVRARELGLATLVTDHHQADSPPEGADCVINPNLDRNPVFNVLSGAGVAFFLAASARACLRDSGFFTTRGEPDLRRLLDLVALGTIADMMPLTGINRILARAGMERMNLGARPGLAALMRAAGLVCGHVGGRDVSFVIAPRINAAGRMGEAGTALELLLATDRKRAEELGQRLEALNRQRREITEAAVADIKKSTEIQKEPSQTIRIFKLAGLHLGVIGLVAARLMRELDLPVLVFSLGQGLAVGSGRAPDGCDLFAMLARHRDLFDSFGGHGQACGLKVRESRLPELESRLRGERVARRKNGATAPLLRAEAGDLFAPGFLDEYERLEPFGRGNPQPLFSAELAVTPGSVSRLGEASLRFAAGDGNGGSLPAVAFNAAEKEQVVSRGRIRALFRLERNHFRGRADWRMVIEGIEGCGCDENNQNTTR